MVRHERRDGERDTRALRGGSDVDDGAGELRKTFFENPDMHSKFFVGHVESLPTATRQRAECDDVSTLVDSQGLAANQRLGTGSAGLTVIETGRGGGSGRGPSSFPHNKEGCRV